MKPILVALLLGLVLFFSGCTQHQESPAESAAVVAKTATEEWKADGAVGESEYSHSMLLQSPARQGYSGGEMIVSWRNDNENLYLAMNGSTDGWLAIGFEPLEWMKNADIIIASVQEGKAVALDEYCTGNYGPHLEDKMLGGTDDISEFAGSQKDGQTVIELQRKLDTGDKFDKQFSPGQTISMIWALSDRSDPGFKHNVAYGEAIMTLSGEQTAPAGAAAATISQREKDGLLFIWEEEKTARDLYASLFERYDDPIFSDLARSEQSHMDQARAIIDEYGLAIPGKDEQGVFENQTLQKIHDELLARGLQSHEEALQVAATFEEISIMDLKKELDSSQVEDAKTMYQGLLAGSRKHLRSYVSDLEDLNIKYDPQYLDRDEFEGIVRTN
ncbi:MAG: DOMON domain protein [Methanosaeta sp. PtaU1.Bin112]|nr:MAG: DOMON domain protein [Methanosaeta sp. PtaU1.Bin112]